MKIKRKRFVVMRNNRTEILVGLARNYYFKKIDEIGDSAIKTYLSEKKAKSACDCWNARWLGDVEILPVQEIIEIIGA